MIPYGKQDITQEDIDSVIEVLKSDFLTQGPVVPEFEKKISEYCGAKYAVSTNSATSALHIACLALGLGEGDFLWTSPITFVASSNCALYCGAKVDFIDIDPDTYNISILALENKLIEADKNGTLPKIIVPVHLCGQSCEMKKIHALSKKYGFRIIEDASHAVGGSYENRRVGSGIYSDITIFSFHPVKIITTGEGGMAVTNSSSLAEQMQLLRSHGITRDSSLMTHEPDGPWYYQQIMLGYNYRMTDIQAALGLSQLTRLKQYIDRRHDIAERYNQSLDGLPVKLPYQHPDSYSAFHLYIIRLTKNISYRHQEVFNKLKAEGIMVNLHYIPVHLQPYYKRMGFKKGDFPNSEEYYSEAITLPIYPGLTDVEHDYICSTLNNILSK